MIIRRLFQQIFKKKKNLAGTSLLSLRSTSFRFLVYFDRAITMQISILKQHLIAFNIALPFLHLLCLLGLSAGPSRREGQQGRNGQQRLRSPIHVQGIYPLVETHNCTIGGRPLLFFFFSFQPPKLFSSDDDNDDDDERFNRSLLRALKAINTPALCNQLNSHPTTGILFYFFFLLI
jgi:hypothetical protein